MMAIRKQCCSTNKNKTLRIHFLQFTKLVLNLFPWNVVLSLQSYGTPTDYRQLTFHFLSHLSLIFPPKTHAWAMVVRTGSELTLRATCWSDYIKMTNVTLWRAQQPQILTLSRNSPTPTQCSTEKNINNPAIVNVCFLNMRQNGPIDRLLSRDQSNYQRKEGGEYKIEERCEKRNTCTFYFKLSRNCSWMCR